MRDVAIVGAGAFGLTHATAIDAHPALELRAVVGSTPESAAELANRFGAYPGRLDDGGVAAVTLDGRSIGGAVDTSTTVRSFKTEYLDRVMLRRGRHVVRFTVVDKHVDSAGMRLSLDLLALMARGG